MGILMVLMGTHGPHWKPEEPSPPQGSSGRESTTLIIIKLADICTGHKQNRHKSTMFTASFVSLSFKNG